ncbi:MAG: hypothetical protein K5905_24715 [Roseibium sp.]|uniref:hypothetical protein n=1 Tax=Roseibium sp. TaxID=1936156 RepID=UPI0026365015|nr:hypothetical protein [Roseibium sp.]MCV0428672.1 hypothetical protein [Roseibium sp.]
MKQPIDLEPNCTACAALCCVVFAFDRSESFAIDKAAGEVCPNLDAHQQCKIFSRREHLGFKGCITYTCYGAGQRVSQDVFGGTGWDDDPTLKERMGAALSVLRRIHEQLVLLRSAERLPLDDRERKLHEEIGKILVPETKWSEASLSEFPIDSVTNKVSTFLRSLRHHVTG